MLRKGIHHVCHSRLLLTYRHIDTDNVLAFLIYDSVKCYRSFTCLSVAYNKFTLTPAYRYHRVDSLDTGLQWSVY